MVGGMNMFCGFGGSGFGGYGYGFGAGMLIMMAFRILIFIGLIVLVVKVVKNYTTNYAINSNSALKILDEKFASGEISEEEYTKKRNLMRQNR
jgi:putative membrane protein